MNPTTTVRRQGKNRRLRIIGTQRKEIDAHLYAQAVVGLAEDLARMDNLIARLLAEDARIELLHIDKWKALRLGDHLFLVVQGARFMCRLPEDVLKQVLHDIHIRRWWPNGAGPIPDWVEFGDPFEEDGERYVKIAMEYAGKQTDERVDPAISMTILRQWYRPRIALSSLSNF